eukprot:1527869-Rhodomonas_salina.7
MALVHHQSPTSVLANVSDDDDDARRNGWVDSRSSEDAKEHCKEDDDSSSVHSCLDLAPPRPERQCFTVTPR